MSQPTIVETAMRAVDNIANDVPKAPVAEELPSVSIDNTSLVPLLQVKDGKAVPATLIDGLSTSQIGEADSVWKEFLQHILEKRTGVLRASYSTWQAFVSSAFHRARAGGVSMNDLPENPHWDWKRKQSSATIAEGSHSFGVEYDGMMQGLCLVRTDKRCRLTTKAGEHMVYVDYIATAPWNLPKLAPNPLYRGAGLILMAAAIQWSKEKGWDGRVGLHSLPGAEDFYKSRKKCGMTDLGIDPVYENLRYFEMNATQANEFLKRMKEGKI